MSSKQNGDRRMKGGSRKPRRKDPPAASRRVRDPEETPPDLDRQVIAGRIAEGESSNRNPISSLRDGGIRWVFYLWKSEVPEPELARIAWSARAGFLRAAVTFGFPDWDSEEYRSTTTVHLWDLGNAYTRGFRPPDGDWGRMMIHILTHEPLHHAIGLGSSGVVVLPVERSQDQIEADAWALLGSAGLLFSAIFYGDPLFEEDGFHARPLRLLLFLVAAVLFAYPAVQHSASGASLSQ